MTTTPDASLRSPTNVILNKVVAEVRQQHSTCDQESCPWPLMWEYDVGELADALAAAGYAIVRTTPPDSDQPVGKS